MSLAFAPDDGVASWGRVGRRSHQVSRPRFADAVSAWNAGDGGQRLAVGARRSYGDVGLASASRLIDMTALDRFRAFNPATGELKAEAGMTLDSVMRRFVPLGWFPPVTPGTRHVTLGGAVANDVHGKNHHTAGTLGRHVSALTVLRSDRGPVETTPEREPALFAATVGGMGLTGLVLDVTLRLQRIRSAWLETQTTAHPDLDSLCDGLAAVENEAEHTVAWIDCTRTGASLGRGLLTRADWSAIGGLRPHADGRKPAPGFGLINPVTLRAFNEAWYALGAARAGVARARYERVFHPLDGLDGWNRLYGRAGFHQFQCVIPAASGREPIRDLLRIVAASREGSFLAVLKSFGGLPSPGLMSFPQAGLTLAVDLRHRGAETLALLSRLHAVVAAANGRLYAAKDSYMTPALFRAGYPALDRFAAEVDPACSSDFWRRMNP